MGKLTLVSADEKHFIVDVETAGMSTTIANMLDSTEGENPEEEIPIPNVTGDTLEKVILWAEHHKGDDGEASANMKHYPDDGISSWDLDFFGTFDIPTIKQLMSAANFLDISGLLDVACKIVANRLKNKTPDEIREILGIENDFDAKQEEFIRKENEWCEER